MPKVISYTPSWLSGQAPGHEIFTPAFGKAANEQGSTYKPSAESSRRNARPGPRRTIARRGTEVFIAVGKEIRWADLVYLKERWEDKQENSHGKSKILEDEEDEEDEGRAQGYRTIKTTVSDDIRQLIISPHSNYLAILTTHTVHIALLPDSSHLTAHDTTPLRLKIYTLGPVTHVTTQSAVVSALWHPLGVNGSCIVTITEDAVVRVWELSTADRWSFDRPTLAIDLKKLADGTSLDQDFGASVSGINKGFSPDSFEMEVAAACFGGRGSGGWSPMTLWIAMREGDVYALCPLLPEKWAPPPALIPSLSVSIVAKVASMEDDPEISEQLKLLSQQQLAWMSDLDNQDPVIHEAPMGEPSAEIYTRPVKPGRVPKLQGPFEFDLSPEESEDELDSLLSDIYVIGGKIDAEELMYGEEDDLEMDDVDQEGLSMNLVCLLSSSGRVSICLDLYGIEAQWLPNTKSKFRRFVEDLNPPSLLTFQIMDTLKSEEVDEDSWPMFSSDVNSRYSFFVTHASSITFLSLSPWVFRLESELRANTTSGVDFRIDLLVKNTNTIRERLITQPAADDLPPLAAAIAILDPDLGYFLLTSTPHGPIALSFDAPELSFSPPRSRSPTYEDEPQPQPLLLCAPRQVYEPSRALFAQSSLPEFLDSLRRGKYKRVLHEPIRLSPATLTILTDAHKILSEETHRLGTAAAELFRRCERLQIELREQIERANEVANRVDAVVGDDADVDPGVLGGNEGVEKRLHDVKLRQLELAERVDRVKKKASKGAAGRQLSEKEKAWIEEIETLGSALLSSTAADPHPNKQKRETPSERFDAVTKISSTILANFSAAEEKFSDDSASVSTTGRSVRVPTELRKQKVAEVMELLEREGALVEGAKSRLEKLNLAS